MLLPSVLYGFSNGLNSMYEVALHIDIILVVVNGTVRAMYVDTWKSTSTPSGTGTRKVLYIHTYILGYLRTYNIHTVRTLGFNYSTVSSDGRYCTWYLYN